MHPPRTVHPKTCTCGATGTPGWLHPKLCTPHTTGPLVYVPPPRTVHPKSCTHPSPEIQAPRLPRTPSSAPQALYTLTHAPPTSHNPTLAQPRLQADQAMHTPRYSPLAYTPQNCVPQKLHPPKLLITSPITSSVPLPTETFLTRGGPGTWRRGQAHLNPEFPASEPGDFFPSPPFQPLLWHHCRPHH